MQNQVSCFIKSKLLLTASLCMPPEALTNVSWLERNQWITLYREEEMGMFGNFLWGDIFCDCHFCSSYQNGPPSIPGLGLICSRSPRTQASTPASPLDPCYAGNCSGSWEDSHLWLLHTEPDTNTKIYHFTFMHRRFPRTQMPWYLDTGSRGVTEHTLSEELSSGHLGGFVS